MTSYNWGEIGKRIKKEREAHALTMEALAEKVGTSRQTISRWEKGEGVEITLNMLLRMCDIFGCELGYMLGEFPCKTRAATDICAVTGLSEEAVAHITSMYCVGEDSTESGEVARNGMELLNILLESGVEYLYLSEMVSVYLDKQKRASARDTFAFDEEMSNKYLEFILSNKFIDIIRRGDNGKENNS